MKITKETPTLLIIKSNDKLYFLIFGIILILGGVFFIFYRNFLGIKIPQNFFYFGYFWEFWYFGAHSFLIGLLSIFLYEKMIIVIDKNNQKISFIRKSLINNLMESVSKVYDFSQIRGVKIKNKIIKSYEGFTFKKRTLVSFTIVFILNDGKEILLETKGRLLSYYLSKKGPSLEYRHKEKIAQKISNFIGVPFSKIEE